MTPGVPFSTTSRLIPAWPGASGPHGGGDEVGPHAAGDEGLGPVDDVAVRVGVPARGGPDRRDVRPATGLGDRQRADELAGQRRSHPAVHLLRGAAGGEVRQCDAAGEQRRHQPARRTRVEAALLQRDRVQQVAALAADGRGERDAEQPLPRRRGVQGARHLAAVLPLLQVRRHLAAHELGGHLAERGPLPRSRRAVRALVPRPRALLDLPSRRSSLVPRALLLGHRSDSSIATIRERAHSPSPLACGSKRVDAATPRPSSPWITTFTAPRLGSR